MTNARSLFRAPIKAVMIAILTIGIAGANPSIEAYYRGYTLHNSDGGLRTGSAYLDDAGLTISAQLDGLSGGSDANFFAYLLYNNGASFSDVYVGDLQVVSNIDAPQAVRIYELWYEQSWAGKYSLKVGLYDLNSEFDAIDMTQLFMNSSHGIGAEYGQSGVAGPSIFPVTSFAVRFDWQLSEAGMLRYALLDGVPGDPNDPSKTKIRFSSDEGVLHALEYDHVLPGGMRLGLGGWQYSEKFDLLEGQDINGAPLRDDGNRGVYGFVETPLLSAHKMRFDMSAFLRYGIANDEINVLDRYVGGGIVVSGLVDSRPDDQLGLAFANARVGDPFKRASADAGDTVESAEMTVELTYSAQLTDWLRIQPDIQYVINPGADPGLGNALVFGFQFELTAARD